MSYLASTMLLIGALQTAADPVPTQEPDDDLPRVAEIGRNAFLRARPTGISDAIAEIAAGETVMVLRKADGDFWEVSYGDVRGFIHDLMLSRRPSEPSPPEPGALGTSDQPLIQAAWQGDTPALASALERQPIDAKDDTGRTALMVAAAGGHMGAVRMLVAAGAGIDVQAENGWNALAYAEAGRHAEITRYLLDRGATWPDGELQLETVFVGGGVETERTWDVEPVPVDQPRHPEYPPEARDERLSGEVVLQIRIPIDGSTEVLGVIKPLLYCTEPAIDHARRWVWKPATKNGEPIESVGTLAVSFDLWSVVGRHDRDSLEKELASPTSVIAGVAID